MPFTLSHPAAVLPLSRYRLPLSALVAGSIAPDLPHVLLLSELSGYGHTLPGVFIVSLPVGLAALFLFQVLLKRPLLALSPDTVRLRIPVEKSFAFRAGSHIAWALASLLIGLITHILWDSFTHSNGFLVVHWPLLRKITPFWPYRPIYKFLQLLFSVVGLAAIAFAYRSWIRNTPKCHVGVIPAVAPRVVRVALLGAGTLMTGAFGLLYTYFSYRMVPVGFWTFLANFLFGSMAAAFFVILLFSLWWHLHRQRLFSANLASGV